jgi:rubrerythrin
MNQEKLTILTLGVHNEKMGQDFYAEAARRSSDEQGRNMFNYLASMEEDHMRILLAEYEVAQQGKDWLPSEEALARGKGLDIAHLPALGEVPEGVLLPPYIFPPPEEAPGIQGDIAVLEYGLEMEERSYDLYKDGLEKSADPNAKEMYARLMKEENEHYRILQETHAYLSTNETWWDDWQRPFFEG